MKARCRRPAQAPLGPSRPAEFPPEVRTFILAKMKKPLLTEGEVKSLQKVDGRWPAYPNRLLELARRKGLVIPGMSLPGPRQMWQQAVGIALAWRFDLDHVGTEI